jgi:hypothetical protein
MGYARNPLESKTNATKTTNNFASRSLMLALVILHICAFSFSGKKVF